MSEAPLLGKVRPSFLLTLRPRFSRLTLASLDRPHPRSFNPRRRRWTCCRPSTRRLSSSLRTRRRRVRLLPTPRAILRLALADPVAPARRAAAENLQRLITECGVSPTKVAELVQELPPKDFANILVDWFFAKINSSRYPIHEGMFRGASPCAALHLLERVAYGRPLCLQTAAYESLYANGLKTDPSNVRSLPLVFIVLATVRALPLRFPARLVVRAARLLC